MIENFFTYVPPALAAVAALVFMVLYHKRAKWTATRTGINVMSMAACLVLMTGGSLIRRFIHDLAGSWIINLTWLVIAVVIVWRTIDMYEATGRRPAPPPTPVSPTEEWKYTPSPMSVIEHPRRGE